MYNDYFGLREAPFSIAPNPEYLYMSQRHREALAHLLYGIKSDGGFILLTGEVGTGKTTVCRCLLEQIPEEVDIAFVLNPKLTAVELLATACDDLGITYPAEASIKVLVDLLNEYLLAAHQQDRRVVLIIDEAQNLSIDVLEQLRLLTNLETNKRKLLQIILLGQPELLELLSSPELRQLSQRVTARFHLDALTRDEVREYIRHRLSVAGARGNFFSNAVMDQVFRLSGGIPRLVNLICDRALLGTYAENHAQVARKTVDKAAQEVFGVTPQAPRKPRSGLILALATAAAVFAAAGIYFLQNESLIEAPVASTPVSPPPVIEAAPVVPPEPTPVEIPDEEPVAETATADVETPAVDTIIATATPIESTPPVDDIADVAGHETLDLAYTDLFTAWGLYFPDEEREACVIASDVGLACFNGLSSFRDLRHLDRPAILNINSSWVTLTEASADTVTLIARDREYRIAVDELTGNWDGEYILFWRTPAGYELPVSKGDQGPVVNALAQLLDASLSDVTEFDDNIDARIRRFQLSAGLTPDGIAGARTWILLNSRGDEALPTLARGDN